MFIHTQKKGGGGDFTWYYSYQKKSQVDAAWPLVIVQYSELSIKGVLHVKG